MEFKKHSPQHRFNFQGSYIVTGATLYKEHYFRAYEDLDMLESHLFQLAQKYGWNLDAWAIFSNHYHFVAVSPSNPENLPLFVRHFHSATARELNKRHGAHGRRIWYQYWDTQITYERSYLARLNYVMHNPEKHGLVKSSKNYKWCSCSWFARVANASQLEKVLKTRIDRVKVKDVF